MFRHLACRNVNHCVVLHSDDEKSAGQYPITKPRAKHGAHFLVKALYVILRSQTLNRQHKRSIKRVRSNVADEHRHRIGGSQHQRLMANLLRIIVIVGVFFRDGYIGDAVGTHCKRNVGQRSIGFRDGPRAGPFSTDHYRVVDPTYTAIVFVAVFHIGKPKLRALGRVLSQQRHAP